jgi:hypothetical protein
MPLEDIRVRCRGKAARPGPSLDMSIIFRYGK